MIRQLVSVHGSQGKVAQRLGKTPAWVSQRLALLDLTPELQKKVEAGELKVEPARRISRLPKNLQAAETDKTIDTAKPPRQRSRRAAGKPSEPQTVNAVNTPPTEVSVGIPYATTVNGVNGADGLAVPAEHIVVPYASPQQVVEALVAHLTATDLLAVAELLLDRVGEHPGPDAT